MGNDGGTVFCPYCGNEGKEGGCEHCGRLKGKINLPSKQAEQTFVHNAQWKLIPNEYIGVLWNKDALVNSHPERCTDGNFSAFATLLNRVVKTFRRGSVYPTSLFISAPSGFSKEIFAYTCMQYALKNEITVAPFLDSTSVERLLKMCARNPNYKIYNFIDYDSYITSMVCFVAITNLPEHSWSIDLIKELLDRRSRLGLPTYFISPYPLKELGESSRLPFTSILDLSQKHLGARYPQVFDYIPTLVTGGENLNETNN